MVGALVEAEVAGSACGDARCARRRDAGQHHRQGDVLGGGQARHQVEALEDEADAFAAHRGLLVGRQRGDVAPFEQIGAAIAGRSSRPSRLSSVDLPGPTVPSPRDVFPAVDAGQPACCREMDRCRRGGKAALDTPASSICGQRLPASFGLSAVGP